VSNVSDDDDDDDDDVQIAIETQQNNVIQLLATKKTLKYSKNKKSFATPMAGTIRFLSAVER